MTASFEGVDRGNMYSIAFHLFQSQVRTFDARQSGCVKDQQILMG